MLIRETKLWSVIKGSASCRCSVQRRAPISFSSSILLLMPTNQNRPSFANLVKSCGALTQRKVKSRLSPVPQLYEPAQATIWCVSLKQVRSEEHTSELQSRPHL